MLKFKWFWILSAVLYLSLIGISFAADPTTNDSQQIRPNPNLAPKVFTCTGTTIQNVQLGAKFDCSFFRDMPRCPGNKVVLGVFSSGVNCWAWCGDVVPVCGWN